jgi:CRISPR-associated protein Csx1
MLNAIEPDRTIVFVADTIGVDDGIEEYQGILKKAKGEIENLFGKEVLERLKIELVPSKGSFSTDQNSPYRYKFERSIRDYSVVSLLKIVKELLELIAEREGERRVPIELHLDMSRGINFMSPILLKNLELVGKALSYFTEVTLFSYNSDPFVSKIPPEAQRLNVNLVEREKLVPAVPQSRIERTSLTFTGEERRYLNGILGGFYFALPLLIATSCSRIEVDKLLAKAFEDGDSYWERVEFKIEKRLEKIREKEVEKEYRIYKFSPFEEDFEKVILSLFLGKITKLAFPDLQKSGEGIKENILRKIASSYPFLFAERELQTLKERIKKWENRLKEEEKGAEKGVIYRQTGTLSPGLSQCNFSVISA